MVFAGLQKQSRPSTVYLTDFFVSQNHCTNTLLFMLLLYCFWKLFSEFHCTVVDSDAILLVARKRQLCEDPQPLQRSFYVCTWIVSGNTNITRHYVYLSFLTSFWKVMSECHITYQTIIANNGLSVIFTFTQSSSPVQEITIQNLCVREASNPVCCHSPVETCRVNEILIVQADTCCRKRVSFFLFFGGWIDWLVF